MFEEQHLLLKEAYKKKIMLWRQKIDEDYDKKLTEIRERLRMVFSKELKRIMDQNQEAKDEIHILEK